MEQFLKKYKNHANIAANDIGAITYFTEIKLGNCLFNSTYAIINSIGGNKT